MINVLSNIVNLLSFIPEGINRYIFSKITNHTILYVTTNRHPRIKRVN